MKNPNAFNHGNTKGRPKMTLSKINCALAIFLICSFAVTLSATELKYNGTLADSEGRLVPDGNHVFDFTIFTAPVGGTAVWAEIYDDVWVEKGAYSIVLGSRTSLELPAGEYWVQVVLDGEVLDPRVKIALAAGDCTMTNDLRVDGNLGIGTSPSFPLHINQGNVASGFRTYWGSASPTSYGEFKQALADGLIINSNTGGSWAEIRFQNNGVTNMYLGANGNLGIGTDAPGTKLSVNGDAQFGDRSTPPSISGGVVDILNSSGGGTSLLVTSGSFGTQTVFIVEGGGDVGIGIADPTHMLDVGASGAYCDGGAWVNGSSRSFKENITQLSTERALEALENLEPTSFTYKTDPEELYLGFIAEDVPDLVATKDRKGLVAMDIVAVLTKVVQEQQEQIRDLRESMAALQASLAN